MNGLTGESLTYTLMRAATDPRAQRDECSSEDFDAWLDRMQEAANAHS